MLKISVTKVIAVAALAATASGTAAASSAHHHRRYYRAPVAQPPFAYEERSVAVDPQPQWERDGVPGNLPFNNQLRKFSDPLGANGSK